MASIETLFFKKFSASYYLIAFEITLQNEVVYLARNSQIDANGTPSSDNGKNLLLKLDSSGNILFSLLFDASLYLRSLAISSNGTIAISGETPGNKSSDAFLALVDNLGNVLWSKKFGVNPGRSDTPYQIAVHDAYGVVVVGKGGSGLNGSNGFVGKFDIDGNTQWLKVFGGPYADACSSVDFTAQGDILFAGNSWTSGNNNQVISKASAAGNLLWSKRFEGTKFKIKPDGTLYTSGYLNGKSFIAKLNTTDNNLSLIWLKQFNKGVVNDFDISQNGKLVITLEDSVREVISAPIFGFKTHVNQVLVVLSNQGVIEQNRHIASFNTTRGPGNIKARFYDENTIILSSSEKAVIDSSQQRPQYLDETFITIAGIFDDNVGCNETTSYPLAVSAGSFGLSGFSPSFIDWNTPIGNRPFTLTPTNITMLTETCGTPKPIVTTQTTSHQNTVSIQANLSTQTSTTVTVSSTASTSNTLSHAEQSMQTFQLPITNRQRQTSMSTIFNFFTPIDFTEFPASFMPLTDLIPTTSYSSVMMSSSNTILILSVALTFSIFFSLCLCSVVICYIAHRYRELEAEKNANDMMITHHLDDHELLEFQSSRTLDQGASPMFTEAYPLQRDEKQHPGENDYASLHVADRTNNFDDGTHTQERHPTDHTRANPNQESSHYVEFVAEHFRLNEQNDKSHYLSDEQAREVLDELAHCSSLSQ